MTVAQGTPNKFEYLLNAMENASQQQMPSEHGYAGHRAKVIDYVTKLERENAALSAQVAELTKKSEDRARIADEYRKLWKDEENGNALAAATMNGVLANLGLERNDHEQWYNKRAESLAAQVVELQQDAERYAVVKRLAISNESSDQWEGIMWEVYLHDPQCKGLDAAIAYVKAAL